MLPVHYRPQRSCGKVVIYTCLTFCSQRQTGRHPPPWADTPWADTPHPGRHPTRQNSPGRHPLGRHPSLDRYPLPSTETPLGRHPWTDTPGQTPLVRHQQTATAADGTRPTGMHSCLIMLLLSTFTALLLKCLSNLTNYPKAEIEKKMND